MTWRRSALVTGLALGALLGFASAAGAAPAEGADSTPPALPPAAETSPVAPGPASHACGACSPESLLSFADSLAAAKDYYRAITEYRRFAHAFPTHPRVPTSRLAVAAAYRAGGKQRLAAELYLDVVSKHPATPAATRAAFLAAEAYYGAFEYATAAAHYRAFIQDYPAAAERPLAEYRVAWTHIGRHDFAGARQALGRVPRAGPYGVAATELDQRLAAASDVRRRTPWLAGTLAGVLPGAGHLYVGRPKDALLSFLVNGLFAFGTYEAIHHETYTAAALLGMFGVGFYLGNIFGAVNAAHRENKLSVDRYVHDLVHDLEPGTAVAPGARTGAPPPVGPSLGWLGASGSW